jgi:hypothetical protein
MMGHCRLIDRSAVVELLIANDPRDFTEFCITHGVSIHTCSIRKAATMHALRMMLRETSNADRQQSAQWLGSYGIKLHLDGNNKLQSLSSGMWPMPVQIDTRLVESIQ